MKIYCPKCKWKPDGSSLWRCERKCGHVWNTFNTRGVCPKCSKKWDYTQCLSCGVRSLHEEWYHDEDETDEDNLAVFYEYITEELQEPIAAPSSRLSYLYSAPA